MCLISAKRLSIVSDSKMVYGLRSLSSRLLRHIAIGSSTRSASIVASDMFLECFGFKICLNRVCYPIQLFGFLGD